MGDRNLRNVVRSTIDSIGKDLEIKSDVNNPSKIHLVEVIRCMRRSYYDRTDPLDVNRKGFSDLLPGLLRKLQYGCEPTHFEIGDVKVEGQADMIIDDTVLIFRSIATMGTEDIESPHAGDILYLNACLWTYNKEEGIIVYITRDKQETMFSLTRSKKMFEETSRRVKIFSELLVEKKVPIIEPSSECTECQYYDRCYTKKQSTTQISLFEIFGTSKGK